MCHDGEMQIERSAFDDARMAVAARSLTAEASAHLTETVARHLPFEVLVPYKTLIKRFFSAAPWENEDAVRLDGLVGPHLESGWWEHELAPDLTLRHGVGEGGYTMEVTGGSTQQRGLFDRVFAGPVVPEATPHPRKVKFNIGGTAAPGRWWQRGQVVDDPSLGRLFAEPDITDVMVAGDFVTVGLDRTASWETRLDGLLDLVTELFWVPDTPPQVPGGRTRDELLEEGRGSADVSDELHLLDPDRGDHRSRLFEALQDTDARRRRMAVAILADSADPEQAHAALGAGMRDPARIVRRAAVDAAAERKDTAPEFYETALEDGDSWIRWKAVRALGAMGMKESVARFVQDPDFQVRFEAEKVIRG